MMNRSFIALSCLLLIASGSAAQDKPPEELLFKPSRMVKTMSARRFDKHALSWTQYAKLYQKHGLHYRYVIRNDTSAYTQVSLVRIVRGYHERKMIAYRVQKIVTLFEILTPAISSGNLEIKNDKDITGDGIKEVFVYYTQYYSSSHDYGAGQGSSQNLEIWDPVKRVKLFDEKISSGGTAWSMCTGKSSNYSNSKEYTFFTGGFSITERTYRSEDGKEEINVTKKGPVYLYTPKGFVLDRSKDCCTFHLKKNNDEKELKEEYLRLKKENKPMPVCCIYNPGGLYECMQILASKINTGDNIKKISHLFDAPDLDLDHFPTELQSYTLHPAYGNGIRFWSYGIRPNFYLYFILAQDKLLYMAWYSEPSK